MSPASKLDHLARNLGRARVAYERRPDDDRAYALFLEARCAFLEEQGRVTDAELKRERARSAEIGRRLRNRSAAMAQLWQQVQPVRRARSRAPRPDCADLFDSMVMA